MRLKRSLAWNRKLKHEKGEYVFSCILDTYNCIWCNAETVSKTHRHRESALAKRKLCCYRIGGIQFEPSEACSASALPCRLPLRTVEENAELLWQLSAQFFWHPPQASCSRI